MLSHPLTKAQEQLWLRWWLRVWRDDDTNCLQMSQKQVGATAITPVSALKSGAPACRDMSFELPGVTPVEIGQRSSTTLQPAAEMRRRPHMILDCSRAVACLRHRGDEIVKKRERRRGPYQR
jgi:hypothetical protein